MPYYIYTVTGSVTSNTKSVALVREYENFKLAKAEVRRLRTEEPLEDNQIYKIIFADEQAEAEQRLREFREEPIAKEWENNTAHIREWKSRNTKTPIAQSTNVAASSRKPLTRAVVPVTAHNAFTWQIEKALPASLPPGMRSASNFCTACAATHASHSN